MTAADKGALTDNRSTRSWDATPTRSCSIDESLARIESGSGKSGTKEAVVSSPESWMGAGALGVTLIA
jgi:hypothetical protein